MDHSLDPTRFTPAEDAAARQGMLDYIEQIEPGQTDVLLALAVRRDPEGFTVSHADPSSETLEGAMSDDLLLENGTIEEVIAAVYEHGTWMTIEEVTAAEADPPPLEPLEEAPVSPSSPAPAASDDLTP